MGEAELFARWRPAFKASWGFAWLYSYGPSLESLDGLDHFEEFCLF